MAGSCDHSIPTSESQRCGIIRLIFLSLFPLHMTLLSMVELGLSCLLHVCQLASVTNSTLCAPATVASSTTRSVLALPLVFIFMCLPVLSFEVAFGSIVYFSLVNPIQAIAHRSVLILAVLSSPSPASDLPASPVHPIPPPVETHPPVCQWDANSAPNRASCSFAPAWRRQSPPLLLKEV